MDSQEFGSSPCLIGIPNSCNVRMCIYNVPKTSTYEYTCIYIYTYIYIPGITYNLYLNSVYSFTIDQGQRDQEPLDASTDAAG